VNVSFDSLSQGQRAAWLALCFLLLAIVSQRAFWRFRDAPMYDLSPLYVAGSLVSDATLRSHLYAQDAQELNRVGAGPFRQRAAALGIEETPTAFVYLPVFAVPARALAALSWPRARRVLLVLSATGFFAGLALLAWVRRGDWKIWLPPLALAALLLHTPLAYASWLGQLTALVVAVFAAALACLATGRDRAAGLLLGSVAALKLTPLVFAPLLWLAGRRSAALWTLVGALALLALSLVAPGGPALLVDWLEGPLAWGGGVAAWNNQSLSGLILRVGLPAQALFQWTARQIPAWLAALQIGFSLVLLVLAVRALRHPGRGARGAREWAHRAVALGALLSAVAAPLAWSHYLLYAVFATLWLVLPVSQRESFREAAGFAALALLGFALTSLDTEAMALRQPAAPSGLGGLGGLGLQLAISANFVGGLVLFGAVVARAERLGRGGDGSDGAAA
jgi:hypothetical protein